MKTIVLKFVVTNTRYAKLLACAKSWHRKTIAEYIKNVPRVYDQSLKEAITGKVLSPHVGANGPDDRLVGLEAEGVQHERAFKRRGKA